MGKQIIKIFNKIPSPIVNFISVISGTAAFVGYIISFINWFKPGLLERFVGERSSTVFFVIQTIFLVLISYKCIVYFTQADTRLYSFPAEFHKLTHGYRDLEMQIKNKLVAKKINGKDLALLVKTYCDNLLDSLCELLGQITETTIYGCIKLVDATNEEITPRTITDQTVTDFARSSNMPENRKMKYPLKSIPIKENTDFLELMDYNNIRNQFYQPDLSEYSERLKEDDHEYKNSSNDWRQKYLSTVVVPIQIENQLLTNSEDEAYHVIGFLCLDAKDANTFKIKLKMPIVQLVKAYADILYSVFSLYQEAIPIVTDENYLTSYMVNEIVENRNLKTTENLSLHNS